MVDLTSLLNAMKTTSGPSKVGGSQGVDGGANDPQGAFAAILKANVASKTPAQSGNSLPLSGNLVPDGDGTGAESAGVLENRVLKSGLKVLVAGSEPSDQAISEFAIHQGIDPKALKSLLGKDTSQELLADKDSEGLMAQGESNEHLRGLASSQDLIDADPTQQLVDAEGKHNLASLSPDQLVALRASASNLSQAQSRATSPMPAATMISERELASQQSKRSVQSSGTKITDSLKQNLSGSEATSQNRDAKWVNGLKSAQSTPVANSTLDGQKDLSNALSKLAQSADGKLSETPMQQTLALKLMLKVSDSELRKMPQKTADKQIPATKLAPINLLAMQPNLTAPVPETEYSPLQLTVSEASDRSLSQDLKDTQSQDVMKRRDQYNEISRRLSEALGQRITAQVARGEWRVEMELHPRSLGRIEIQLEMKNGELEANFYTANSATKELINDSLPRLRLALEQYGMESAYQGLEQGNNGKSDGNPTEHNAREEHLAKDQSREVEAQKQAKQVTDDGLDILI